MADYRVRFDFPSGLSTSLMVDGNTKLTPHFKVYEYANKKGKITLPQLVLNEKTWKLYNCFEEFRVWYGASINPTSNYRQIAYNKSVGGDANSLHLKGLAIDWKCSAKDKSEERRAEIENRWKIITMSHGIIGGCNWYTNGFHFSVFEDEQFGYKNFVHRDYRHTRSDW